MKLYIVRHGETLFNIRQRVQGWCDSPLTANGQYQAECAGCGLKDIPFVHAYTSVSERAADTAEIILKGRDVPLTYSKKLKEMNFGDLEGEKESPEFYHGILSDDGFASVHGESRYQAGRRALDAWTEIAEKETGSVLVVTHGAVMMNGLWVWNRDVTMKAVDEGNRPENCCVTLLNYENHAFTLEEFCSLAYREAGERILGK